MLNEIFLVRGTSLQTKKASPGFGEAFSVPKAGLEPARLLKDIGF